MASLLDSIRETGVGVIKQAWGAVEGDAVKEADSALRNALGLPPKAAQEVAPQPTVQAVAQAAASNPLTYVALAGLGALAAIVFWRK